MVFDDSSWNIYTSSLVILVESVFRYSAENRQTNRGKKTVARDYRRRG